VVLHEIDSFDEVDVGFELKSALFIERICTVIDHPLGSLRSGLEPLKIVHAQPVWVAAVARQSLDLVGVLGL